MASNVVKVRTYKSDRAYRRDARHLARKGWQVQATSTRTRKWSWLTGFFTNKQIITVTYALRTGSGGKLPQPRSAEL